jgi:hypothetical protein
MSQLLLQGFPDGAIKIGPFLSILEKDGIRTYFTGADNYFSHPVGDSASERFAIAILIANSHVRPCEITRSFLGIPHRTLMNWSQQLQQRGSPSFFEPRRVRGATVMTQQKIAECERLLLNNGIAEAARRACVKESALRKAISSGRIIHQEGLVAACEDKAGTTKSERCRLDAQAAEGLGTACTRADERVEAAMGIVQSALTRFETCRDVSFGGVLAGLPALCSNGLFSGLDKHLSLPAGFYSALHILTVLGFMALARIRRPEGLRHVPPGELGKVIGLDRIPEVRTLRNKIGLLAEGGKTEQWMKELSSTWMDADPEEAGYLYVDGHVRVYHGTGTLLPRRFVSRQKLCLRGTTDYWVNDAIGRPFFVVSKTVTDGLSEALLKDIVPELLKSVPLQPSEEELAADPLLHRFIVVFDREGSSHSLLSSLWEQRIGAITYRKAVKDIWSESDFTEQDVPVPGGGSTKMKLATRESTLTAGKTSIPVTEIRRLTQTGHQTAIITTARGLCSPVLAGRMFSRWCQENFFGYMMEHYDIDGLVEYGSQDLPGTAEVVNPAWRILDKTIRSNRQKIHKLYAELGRKSFRDDDTGMQKHAELLQDIKQLEADTDKLRIQRRKAKRKVKVESLPEEQRPRQLLPMAKMLTDIIKMIAYRAETALVGLLRPHLAKEEEARALIRELFVSAADLEPDEQSNCLYIRIHRMACPAHDKAIGALLHDITQTNFRHPETGMKMIFELT